MSEFLPAGRTSLVKDGAVPLQVQTEYAFRPYPRITTTVLSNGQVVHKVEKRLLQPISSLDEQASVERFLKIQHGEVLNTIKTNPPPILAPVVNLPQPEQENLTTYEKLAAVPGVQRIFHIDAVGNFFGMDDKHQFKETFGAVLKNLDVIMDVFVLAPERDRRERGVCEVERDRLYFVSCGRECYFLSVRRVDGETCYEKVIKKAISPDELSL